MSGEAPTISGTNIPQDGPNGFPNATRWILNQNNVPEITRFNYFSYFSNLIILEKCVLNFYVLKIARHLGIYRVVLLK